MNVNYITASPSFGSIKILEGGEKFLKQNDPKDFDIIMNAKDEFADSKWHLEVRENGYIFLNPETKRTYTGPYTVKRHVRKHYQNPKLTSPRILVNMKLGEKTTCYSIACTDDNIKEKAYQIIKHSKGAEKILNIFRALESKCINLIKKGDILQIK